MFVKNIYRLTAFFRL